MAKRQRPLESMGPDLKFWRGRRVFLTGHTGFKGAWLTVWLLHLGAKVKGYSLAPPTRPSLFQILQPQVVSVRADIRNRQRLFRELAAFRPEAVFHLAAQPLVRVSYREPYETYSVNVMGTVHLLEASLAASSVKSVVVVTSDKCYRESFEGKPFDEKDPLGGSDPYSASKACAEHVVSGYQGVLKTLKRRPPGLATVRAGNVIGGGDWARDRLIPDCLRAFENKRPVCLRNVSAVRPWQHVLDPLCGYLTLAERLWKEAPVYSGAWNFGPDSNGFKPVGEVVRRLSLFWGDGARSKTARGVHPHESQTLCLSSRKAKLKLGWKPRWNLDDALKHTVEWHHAFREKQDMKNMTRSQLSLFERTLA